MFKISKREIEFLLVLVVITTVITLVGNYVDQLDMQKNIVKSILNGVGAGVLGIIYYAFRNVK